MISYLCTIGTIYAAPNEGDVRLIGGSSNSEGRVEVYHNSQWGTVCDNQWDLTDASVVCQQLGFGGATSAPGQAAFGEGSGPIFYYNVDCSGTEASLGDCSLSTTGNHNCAHADDAGVVCYAIAGQSVEQCSYGINSRTTSITEFSRVVLWINVLNSLRPVCTSFARII